MRIAVLATALASAVASFALADPAAAAIRTRTNIAPQELSSALRVLAAERRLQILYTTDTVIDRPSAGAVGEFTVDEALTRILSGTGLRFRYVDENTITIVSHDEGASTSLTPNGGGARGTRGTEGEQSPAAEKSFWSRFRLAQSEARSAAQADRSGQDRAPAAMDRKIEESQQFRARIELEEVVVTGSHIRGHVNKTVPTMVLDREYIESSGLSTTTRLIESLPQNFSLANQSATPGNPPGLSSDNLQGSSINLRGLGEGTTLILLNGRRLPLGFGGSAVDISALPLSAIERVEVLTDGASALYGSDAVGGVVNFVLRRDYERAETRLRSGWADGADEYRLSQVLGARWDTGNMIASAEYYSRDLLESRERDFVPSTVLVQSLLPEDENLSAMLSGRQRIGDAVELFADALYMRRDTSNRSDRAGTFGGVTFNGMADGENTQLSLTTGADWRLSESWKLETSASFGSSEIDLTSTSRVDYPVVTADTTYEIRQVEIKADGKLFELPGGFVRAALGSAWRAEDYESALTQFGKNSVDSDQEVKSLYAELNVPLVGDPNKVRGVHALELSLAARYDDYSKFGSSVDPRIGFAWEPASGLRLRGSWGTSYVAPKLSDYDSSFKSAAAFFGPDTAPPGLSYQLFVIGPDTDGLGPQESESYSVGLDFEPRAVAGLKMSIGYFDVEYTDKIATPPVDSLLLLGNPGAYGSLFIRDPTAAQVEAAIAHAMEGQGFFAYNADFTPNTTFTPDQVDVIIDNRRQNLSMVSTRGFDFNMHYGRSLAGSGEIYVMLNAAYLLDRPERVTPTSAEFDTVDTIYYPVATRVRAGTGWSGARWSLNGFVNYTGDYTDNRFAPAAKVSSFTSVDANVSYRFTHTSGPLSGLSLSLSAQNLFDRDPPSTRVLFDPFIGASFDMGFDPANASPLGRLLSLELVKAWD